MSNILKIAGAGALAGAETDPNFNQTVLLLHGDGTNGAQNNTFLDSSTNNFTVTRNGNTTQGSVSPFGRTSGNLDDVYDPAVNGGSGYFDGTGDWLSVASDTDFDCGTGNWTLEAWVYILSETRAYPIICGNANAAYATAGSLAFGNHNTDSATFNNKFIIASSDDDSLGSDLRFADSTTHSLNTWIHIAVVRDSSTTLKMYRDGALVASTSNIPAGFTFNWGLNGFRIGGGNWDGANRSEINAYVSNLRLIKGQSLTTGAFTPPTAPLQSGVVGWTGANVAASITGTEAIITNFTNAGIFDQTGKNNLETVGNAQIDTTTKKYGTGSMEFDGTGDWLLMANTPDQQLGTGNFTIEFWVYLASGDTGSNRGLVGKGGASTGWLVSLNTTEKVVFTYTTSTITSSGAITTNAWNHIAVVREGTGSNETKIYIGGTNDGTGTVSTNFNQTEVMYVGANRAAGDPMKGFIDDLRITKGVARYTTTFTPPDAPFLDQ
jgi:hypothetical protein